MVRWTPDGPPYVVEICVFPEMCITGYRHVRNLSRTEIEDLAEPIRTWNAMLIDCYGRIIREI